MELKQQNALIPCTTVMCPHACTGMSVCVHLISYSYMYNPHQRSMPSAGTYICSYIRLLCPYTLTYNPHYQHSMQQVYNIMSAHTYMDQHAMQQAAICLYTLTYNPHHQHASAVINTGEEGIVHDRVLCQKLTVCKDGLHQHKLGV